MKIRRKQNLLIAWTGYSFTEASISLVMPPIPVYVEQLGTSRSQVELSPGLTVSVMAFAATIVTPIWGNLADRKGWKIMMIRAAVGMTITIGALTFVPNAYQLLIMRFMNGILFNYIPNATAMITSQASKEKNGWALGTLSTDAIVGMLIAPSVGGALAQWLGMENVFVIAGVVLFITTLSTTFLVKEDPQPVEKKNLLAAKRISSKTDYVSVLIGLFVTTLTLQLRITSISPVLTLYVRSLSGDTENVLFASSLIVSITGVSAIISSPTLGEIGDRIRNQKVLLDGLILSFICYIPMALVQAPLQLGALRLLSGFSTDALMPSTNTLISEITPTGGVSRIYGYNQICNNFGQVLGPMVESTVTHGFGYSSVSLVTACFVLGNIRLFLFNFREVLNKKL